jgi:dTDP-4-dehydrorhamnose reductase
MRILILGGDGMLGHQLLQSWQGRHEVRVTLRRGRDAYEEFGLFDEQNSFFNVDVLRLGKLSDIFKLFKPEAVINAVGIVKQRPESREAIASIETNALLPHKLALLCADSGGRLIHLSTDCVFSGKKGQYTEEDETDAQDLYGRSKLLGEVVEKHCLTLRTSIIGLELARKKSLVEWFLARRGQVRGYTKAIYTGFTTAEMARIIEMLLLKRPSMHGVWHVASHSIDKYSLLNKLQGYISDGSRQLVPENEFICDRSLVGQRFEEASGYAPPSWDDMLQELAGQIGQRSLTSRGG